MVRKHASHTKPAQERYKLAKPSRTTLHHGRNLFRTLMRNPEHPDVVAWLAKNSVTIERIR